MCGQRTMAVMQSQMGSMLVLLISRTYYCSLWWYLDRANARNPGKGVSLHRMGSRFLIRSNFLVRRWFDESVLWKTHGNWCTKSPAGGSTIEIMVDCFFREDLVANTARKTGFSKNSSSALPASLHRVCKRWSSRTPGRCPKSQIPTPARL